jgi:hypothetical protein
MLYVLVLVLVKVLLLGRLYCILYLNLRTCLHVIDSFIGLERTLEHGFRIVLDEATRPATAREPL